MPKLFIALAATVLLLVGHVSGTGVIVGLVNTVIGIGGRGDTLSARVPAKLDDGVVPPGYQYDPIPYPASYGLSASTAVATPLVYSAITNRPGEPLIVVGYSEGTLAAEAAKRLLVKNNTGPSPNDLSFVQIASPFAANGGMFARFPGIGIPLIVNNMGSTQASPYNTTYVINEYDPFADFPAYFNPIALLNSLAGFVYAHPDAYYNSIDLASTPTITTTVTNSAQGHDTYVFVPNPDLPLLAPLRQIAGALRITPLVKPVLDAVEPLLRVAIDMAYTDRDNLNPAALTRFSLLTPLPRIIAALRAIPGAIGQGVANFVNDIRAELHPAASTPTPAAPKTAAPMAAVPTSTGPTKAAPKITAPTPTRPKRPTHKAPPPSTDAAAGTADTTKDSLPQKNRATKGKPTQSTRRAAARAA